MQLMIKKQRPNICLLFHGVENEANQSTGKLTPLCYTLPSHCMLQFYSRFIKAFDHYVFNYNVCLVFCDINLIN